MAPGLTSAGGRLPDKENALEAGDIDMLDIVPAIGVDSPLVGLGVDGAGALRRFLGLTAPPGDS